MRTFRFPEKWIWSAGLLVAFALMLRRGPHGGDFDDTMYLQVLQKGTLVAWLTERHAIWSGRTLIDAVTILVIPHAWLWRVVNAVLLVSLLWSIPAMIRAERSIKLRIFLAVGFLLIDSRTMYGAVLWVTGSFNYLWPVALGCLAFLPFVRSDARGKFFCLTIPAAFYAGFQEVGGIMLVAFQLMFLRVLAGRRELRWQHVVQTAVTAMALAWVLTAQGQWQRYQVVVTAWFPEYLLLDVVERAFSGIQLSLGHVFGMGRSLVGLLFAATLLGVCAHLDRSLSYRLLAAMPLAVMVLPWAFSASYKGQYACRFAAQCVRKYSGVLRLTSYQDFWIGHASNAADVWLYVSFALYAFAALATAVVLDRVFRRYGCMARAWAVLVWLAALASTAVIGMTPSLYMSGARVFFLQDVMMLGLASAVLFRVIHSGPPASAQALQPPACTPHATAPCCAAR